jgi:N-acetylglucosamine-6-phosphate deacetylase
VTVIKGGRVLTEDGLVPSDLYFDSGVITEATSTSPEVIDADGLIVTPGLIDIQINGGFGRDFTQDPTTIWEVGERLPELGVTAFLPTIVTSPAEVTDLALDVVANRRPPGYRGAEVLGLHFEGPWISPEMHGAHNGAHIVEPDAGTADRWADSGHVKIVTLAPEREGARTVIETLRTAGVVVSLGHTAADFATATDALSSGATLVTHLFNQMTPLGHREPGVVGAALLAARYCLLIVDGLHIADGALEIAWQVLGGQRVILVTDAMAALGLGPGTYPLGDGPITVGDNGPRTTDGRLAGSVVTLPEAMRRLTDSTSASLADALRSVTANPADALGLVDHGDFRHGSQADVTLLDDDLEVVATLVAGNRLFG